MAANKSWLQAIELSGQAVTLKPLERTHAAALLEAASDGRLWELWYTGVPSAESMDQYIETALSDQQAGLALPFVVLDNVSGNIIGSTRFCHADVPNQRIEIGYTWYAKRFQRSAINTECKYLMLTHAFEELETIAVEFRTHWHNQPSRQAIARLGAKQDGILRNHQKQVGGGYRDTVVFSITNNEWPVVKTSLAFKYQQAYQ